MHLQAVAQDLAQEARVVVGRRDDAAGELRLRVGEPDVAAEPAADLGGERIVGERAEAVDAGVLLHVAAVIGELAVGGVGVRAVGEEVDALLDGLAGQADRKAGVAAAEGEELDVVVARARRPGARRNSSNRAIRGRGDVHRGRGRVDRRIAGARDRGRRQLAGGVADLPVERLGRGAGIGAAGGGRGRGGDARGVGIGRRCRDRGRHVAAATAATRQHGDSEQRR